MARGKLTFMILVATIVFAAAPAAALEIGTEFRTTNLQFPWTQTQATGAGVTAFPATNFFFGGTAWFTQPIGEEASIKVSYERDPVLRNTVIADVLFDRGIARIGVGPLVGLFNSSSAPLSAGLSASVRLLWPGVAYFSLRSDGGLAVALLQTGSDAQALTEIAAGFYVPHAIVSAVVTAKRFNEDDAGGNLITDSLMRYALTVDVFKKNVPYTLLTSIGYELRSKHYDASGLTDSLGAIVIGARTSAQINDGLKLTADLSSGFYVFGLDNLKNRGPSSSSFLFSAGLGVVLNIDSLKETHAASSEPPAAPETTPGAATDAPTQPDKGAAPPTPAEKP